MSIPNGSNPEPNGFVNVIHGVFKSEDLNDSGNVAVDLERNDSDKNSKGKDSGIEVKDSFRSDIDTTEATKNSSRKKRGIVSRNSAAMIVNDEVFDSDGSDVMPEHTAHTQEVTVQIEEPSRQNQLPSVSINEEKEIPVQMRSKDCFEIQIT